MADSDIAAQPHAGKPQSHRHKINLEFAIEVFRAGRKNVSQIAREIGVPYGALHGLLVRNGIDIKSWVFKPDWAAIERHRRECAEANKERDALRELRADARYKRYLIQNRARTFVARAVKSLQLVPQPCQECQTVAAQQNGNRGVHAHHCDYSKPLDVIWLCSQHHKDWHRQNKPLYGDLLGDLERYI